MKLKQSWWRLWSILWPKRKEPSALQHVTAALSVVDKILEEGKNQ